MSATTSKDALSQASQFLSNPLSEMPLEEFCCALDIPPEFVRVRTTVSKAASAVLEHDKEAKVSDLVMFLSQEDNYTRLIGLTPSKAHDVFSSIAARIEAFLPVCRTTPTQTPSLSCLEDEFARYLFAPDPSMFLRNENSLHCINCGPNWSDWNNFVEMFVITRNDLGAFPSIGNISEHLQQALSAHVRHGRPWNNQVVFACEASLKDDLIFLVQKFVRKAKSTANDCCFSASICVCESGKPARMVFPDIFAIEGNTEIEPAVSPYPDELHAELLEELPEDVVDAILPAYFQLRRVDASLGGFSISTRAIRHRLMKEYLCGGQDAPYLQADAFSSSVMEAITRCPKWKKKTYQDVLDRWLECDESLADPKHFAELLRADTIEDESGAEKIIRSLQDMRKYVNAASVDLRCLPYSTPDELAEAGIDGYKLDVMAAQCEALSELVSAMQESIEKTRHIAQG